MCQAEKLTGRTLPVAALVLLVTVVAVWPQAAQADDKNVIGVFNSARIFEEYDAARDAREQMVKYEMELYREYQEKERALMSKGEEIESQRMLLGEDKLREKQQEYNDLLTEYKQFQEDVDSQLEQKRREVMGPIEDQVKMILERLGKEEKFDIIIDISAVVVVYLDDKIDVTDQVLESLLRGVED